MNSTTTFKIFGVAACVALLGGCFSADNESAPQALAKTSSTGFCPKLDKFYSEFASRTCNSGGSCVSLIFDAWEPMLECLDIERPAGNTLQDFEALVDDLIANVPSSSEAAEFSECVCGGAGGGTGDGSGSELSLSSAANSQITSSTSSAANSQVTSSTSSAANSQVTSSTSSAAGSSMTPSSSGD